MVIFINMFDSIYDFLIILIDHFVQFSISYKLKNSNLEYLGIFKIREFLIRGEGGALYFN